MDWSKSLDLINSNQRFLVITHHYPDGDALGSVIGLSRYLKHIGKQVLAVSEHPAPKIYQFLNSSSEIQHYDRDRFDWNWPEVIFILDTGAIERLGFIGEDIRWELAKTVCIDHHKSTGILPVTENVVDPTASSVGEMLVDLIITAEEGIPGQVATPLYVAVMTDTGGFRFGNTTPRTFEAAARLTDAGASPSMLHERVYETNRWPRVKLFGEMLQTAELVSKGRIVFSVLPAEAFDRCQASPDDIEGFVEYLRTVDTAAMSLLFRDVDGKIKVSLRSQGDFDVARFAAEFGGGGHVNAAGFVASPPLERVVEETLVKAQGFLKVVQENSEN